MLKLVKYEFMRKYKLLTMILVTAVVLNIFLALKGVEGSILFLLISPVVLYLLYLMDIIKMYGDDLNKKTGYMIFMTPNSGYKIITSKLLTAVLEGFGLIFAYFLFVIANGIHLVISLGEYAGFRRVINATNDILSGSLGYNFNLVYLFEFLLIAVVVIIAFITTVYTAITIRKSLFSEVKYGGLLSFIIFLLINWIISSISDWFFDFLSNIEPFKNAVNNLINTGGFAPDTVAMFFMPVLILAIVQIVALTAFSGYLLEKKINL